MRSHGHSDADGSEHEGDQRHEREQAGGAVEAFGERRVALTEVDDLGLRGAGFPGRRLASATAVVGGCCGSLKRKRSLAREPGARMPVAARAWREMRTRGPVTKLPLMRRSGSLTMVAAMRKGLPPRLDLVSPT